MGNLHQIRSRKYSDYAKELAGVLNDTILEQLAEVTARIEKAYHSGNMVFVAGNGGSAATASHMMADLQKTTVGKMVDLPKRIRAMSLTDNVALLTAWSNDYGFDHVFAGQLRALARPGDVLLAISASGNSPNIVAAIETAIEMGVDTIGLLGFTGGKSKSLCQTAIVVESMDYGIVEDAHSIFMHMMTADLREIVQKG
jgi:D-sedoheptulose 7-phosphate isomerase